MRKILRLPVSLLLIAWSLFGGILFRLMELAGQLMPPNAWGCRVRGMIYKPFLKNCGRNFQVGLQAKLEHLSNIEVGDDVYIGHGSWISGVRGGVKLDDQVMLGPFVRMVSSNHLFENGSARFPSGVGAPIQVGYGTWIAGGATLIAGTTVGRSCLIAAGCVVTSNVPDQAIIGGVPGRIIGSTAEKNNAAS